MLANQIKQVHLIVNNIKTKNQKATFQLHFRNLFDHILKSNKPTHHSIEISDVTPPPNKIPINSPINNDWNFPNELSAIQINEITSNTELSTFHPFMEADKVAKQMHFENFSGDWGGENTVRVKELREKFDKIARPSVKLRKCAVKSHPMKTRQDLMHSPDSQMGYYESL